MLLIDLASEFAFYTNVRILCVHLCTGIDVDIHVHILRVLPHAKFNMCMHMCL